MSNNLEILASVIMDEAFREAELIFEKAEKEANSIREEAVKKQAELRRQHNSNRHHPDIQVKKAKMVSQAELRARMDIIQQKESILENILDTLKQEFLALPAKDQYPTILKKFFIQGLEYLEGDDFTCQVNERDYFLISNSFLEDISSETGKKVSLEDCPLESQGGVIIHRRDGKVLYDNSLEAIFQRRKEEMRSVAAEHLFVSKL